MSKRDNKWMKDARNLKGIKRLNHLFDYDYKHATPARDGSAKARARRQEITNRG